MKKAKRQYVALKNEYSLNRTIKYLHILTRFNLQKSRSTLVQGTEEVSRSSLVSINDRTETKDQKNVANS